MTDERADELVAAIMGAVQRAYQHGGTIGWEIERGHLMEDDWRSSPYPRTTTLTIWDPGPLPQNMLELVEALLVRNRHRLEGL